LSKINLLDTLEKQIFSYGADTTNHPDSRMLHVQRKYDDNYSNRI